LGLALLVTCDQPDTQLVNQRRDSERAVEPTAPRAPISLPFQLIDSTVTTPGWNAMADELTTYRLAVHIRSLVDTLTNVIEPFPILTTDNLVVGLMLRVNSDGAERVLFRHTPGSPGTFRTWRLPDDVFFVYHDVVPSPDGRFFAYVAADSAGTFGMVRELESGVVTIRIPDRGGCECDVDRNHARWFAPDSFEIAVNHLEKGWLVSRGRASAKRFRTDTLAAQPKWH
jgi:hypothetical protein